MGWALVLVWPTSAHRHLRACIAVGLFDQWNAIGLDVDLIWVISMISSAQRETISSLAPFESSSKEELLPGTDRRGPWGLALPSFAVSLRDETFQCAFAFGCLEDSRPVQSSNIQVSEQIDSLMLAFWWPLCKQFCCHCYSWQTCCLLQVPQTGPTEVVEQVTLSWLEQILWFFWFHRKNEALPFCPSPL